MPAPITEVLDSGTAADGNLSVSWTPDPTGQGYVIPTYESNQIRANPANAFSAAYWNPSTFGPDAEVFCTVPVMPGNAIRIYLGILSPATASMDGYELEIDGTFSFITRVDNQTRTTINVNGAHGLTAGDRIWLEKRKNLLTAYGFKAGEWVPLGTATDNTYYSVGNIGLLFQNDAIARVTNFGGGGIGFVDLSRPKTRITPLRIQRFTRRKLNASPEYAVLPVVTVQTFDITPADETDAAVALSFVKPILLSVTPATETDTAQVVSMVKSVFLTPATEIDAAQVLAFTKTILKSITAATETDAAQGLSFVKPIVTSITPALEVDSAQALSVTKTIFKTIAEALETDSAVTLTFTQSGGPIQMTIVSATESDVAQALDIDKAITITAATETDSALARTLFKSVSLTPVSELDEALALDVDKHFTIIAATETDAAQILKAVKSVTLGVATEVDSAQPLSVTKTIFKTLTPAGEVDAAVALSFTGGEAEVLRRAFGPLVIGRF